MKRILWNDGWKLQKGGTFFDAFGFNDLKAIPVELPYDPVIHTPKNPQSINGTSTGYYDGGTYIYTRRFILDDAYWGMPVMLEFEGVMGNAMVYLNGQFAGKCSGGYTGFRVLLTPFLRWDGENELKVVTKTGMQQTSRWYTGAGIYRDVWLDCYDADAVICPDGVRVTTESVEDGLAMLRIDTDVKSYASEGMLRRMLVHTGIYAPDGSTVTEDTVPLTILPGKPVTVRQRLAVENPVLWDLDSPQLYRVSVWLSEGEYRLDTAETTFGIRTLTLDPVHGLRLNGKQLKLRGGCIHHDSGLLGAATWKEYELRRVRLLKEAGFNALRSSHNPISRPLLDACDRLGMLVMDEGFDCWNTGKMDHDYSLVFAENWENDLRAMVEKDYNHPCVFTYSIGNEIPDTGAEAGYLQTRQMAELLHQLDPTRPVSSCINAMFSVMDRMGGIIEDILGKEAIARNQESEVNSLMLAFATRMDDIVRHPVVTQAIEESYTAVDLCGYNYMDARYREDHKRYPHRVIVGSETNALRIADNWALILDCPHVIGDFCWTAMDYIGESAPGQFAATCGDLDLTGKRKAKSYYRETVWGLRDTPAILVGRPEKFGKPENLGNWGWTDAIPSWTLHGSEGKMVQVSVYADADEIELYLNGQLLERKPIGHPQQYIAQFDVAYQPGELTAVAYRDGKEFSRASLVTAGQAVKLTIQPEPMEKGDRIAFVPIQISDKDGNLVTCQDRPVTLTVEGGQCLGFGSADTASSENFYDMTRTSFDGQLLAIIRREEGQPVKLYVSADGLESAAVEI